VYFQTTHKHSVPSSMHMLKNEVDVWLGTTKGRVRQVVPWWWKGRGSQWGELPASWTVARTPCWRLHQTPATKHTTAHSTCSLLDNQS